MSQERYPRPTRYQPTGGRVGPRFEDHLTNGLRVALEDLNEVSHVAGWCAKECAGTGPELADCARICTDVAELAEFNERLIARDSMFGPTVADAFVRVATEALPELEEYRRRPQVAEVVEVLERALDSCTDLMRSAGAEASGRETRGRETSEWGTAGREMRGRGMGGRSVEERGTSERGMGDRETRGRGMGGRGMGERGVYDPY